MTALKKKEEPKIGRNRTAFRDYHILDSIEAGIQLRGTEVKSLRNGTVSLAGSFARVIKGEVFIVNISIPLYDHGNRFNHDPARQRKLLLHSREIKKLQVAVEQKGQVLVPLSMYWKHGYAKVELGICKGKTRFDKRDDIKKKAADRQAARATARLY